MTQRVSGTKSLIVINPNSSQSVTDGIASALSPFEGRGVPIRCLTLPRAHRVSKPSARPI